MTTEQAKGATPARRRRVGMYSHAILWIALNDDTTWLDDPDNGNSASVTLCLVADIFERTVDEATADLRRVIKREKAAQEGLEQARETVRSALSLSQGADQHPAKQGGPGRDAGVRG